MLCRGECMLCRGECVCCVEGSVCCIEGCVCCVEGSASVSCCARLLTGLNCSVSESH